MADVVDLAAAGRALEGRAPHEILRWACDHLGPRLGFATGFGAEGCVLVDVIARHELPIEVLTLDTGLLFPETHELWQRLEARYGIAIRGVAPAQTLAEQEATHGARLWAREPDRCCELRKVRPLANELASFDAWVTAIRRDQTRERAASGIVENDGRFGLPKVNPLAAWTHDDVWAYLYEHDVPYNALHERGYPSIGCQPCTSAIVPGEDLRAGRWRGAGKRECGLHVRPEETT